MSTHTVPTTAPQPSDPDRVVVEYDRQPAHMCATPTGAIVCTERHARAWAA